MRIVFYYGSISNGGAERVITTLANDFTLRGCEVYIVTTDNGESGYYVEDSVHVLPLDLKCDSHNVKQAVCGFVREIRTLRKTMRVIKPDIIFAFAAKMAVMARLSTVGLRTKVIGSERSNPHVAHNTIKEKLFVKMTGCLDGFVFQTQGAMSFYPRTIQKKSIVIPNAVSIRLISQVPCFRERISHSLIATGRVVKLKRYDVMVDAMEKVLKRFPQAKLEIYGDGADLAATSAYIRNKGLSKNVVLKGRISDIPKQLSDHQIFLLASEYEGMPNGLIEAMAAGCVCISSDCDFGPRDLIIDGVNGYLCPVGDSEVMAERIIEIFNDENKAETLSKRAQDICAKLCFETISEKYYEYLIRSRRCT